MRRSAAVAVLALLLALAVGLWRAEDDIHDELRAALSLAAAMGRLTQVGPLDDAAVVDALRAQAREVPLRHLTLSLRDEDGRLLLGRRPEPPAPEPLETLARWHARLRPQPELAPVSWTLPRSGGRNWTVTLSADPDSERREALEQLVTMLGVLAAGALAVLAVMTWNIRHALRPLSRLLAAIEGLRPGTGAALAEGSPPAAARAPHTPPPALPMRELQAIQDAVFALRTALQHAEAERRLLGQKMVTLQEDERSWLARELHDELGQRLTVLRLDASLLQRQLALHAGTDRLDDRVAALAQAQELAASLQAQAARMQQDLRGLLTRLAPHAAAADGPGEAGTGTWLQGMLQTLVQGWARLPAAPAAAAGAGEPDPATTDLRRSLAVELSCELDDTVLAPGLALAVYRISQEALTNAARHARASRVRLQVQGCAGQLRWTVQDDGIGLADPAAALKRGNGLAGMRQRVWAFGGDLVFGDARPGLLLSAVLQNPAAPHKGPA